MKKTCAQLKDTARGNLLGHYSTPIAALVICELLTLIFNIPFTRMSNLSLQYALPGRSILGLIGSLIISLLAIVLSCGTTFIHLQIARRQNTSISDLLYCFKTRPDKFLGYGLLILLLAFLFELPGLIAIIVFALQSVLAPPATLLTASFLFSIVLLAIGLIAYLILMLGLSQTVFLLLDDSEQKVADAMKESLRCMKGQKWSLFKLYLSFLGWFFLGMLTLGIGYLWIEPYCSQSIAVFYLHITGQDQPQPEAE